VFVIIDKDDQKKIKGLPGKFSGRSGKSFFKNLAMGHAVANFANLTKEVSETLCQLCTLFTKS
jgi:hypothetical protein